MRSTVVECFIEELAEFERFLMLAGRCPGEPPQNVMVADGFVWWKYRCVG